MEKTENEGHRWVLILECEVLCPVKEVTFPEAAHGVMPTDSRVTLHWTKSLFCFLFLLGNQRKKLGLLKMKSVTKTLQATSPGSTKTSALSDPSPSSPSKDNHV